MGCFENNIYFNLETDPEILQEYNLILYKSATSSPICGATLTDKGIVTASHCVDKAYDYFVGPSDNLRYPVKIVAIDAFETTDLAVLEPTKSLPWQPEARVAWSEPDFGEDIWVIGCGAGECDALSKGIVSKLSVEGHYGMEMNQFDVTAWYGNSGGGIFNNQGILVGVVSQFGPQFGENQEPEPDAGAETGWMYGCTVEAINRVLAEQQ